MEKKLWTLFFVSVFLSLNSCDSCNSPPCVRKLKDNSNVVLHMENIRSFVISIEVMLEINSTIEVYKLVKHPTIEKIEQYLKESAKKKLIKYALRKSYTYRKIERTWKNAKTLPDELQHAIDTNSIARTLAASKKGLHLSQTVVSYLINIRSVLDTVGADGLVVDIDKIVSSLKDDIKIFRGVVIACSNDSGESLCGDPDHLPWSRTVSAKEWVHYKCMAKNMSDGKCFRRREYTDEKRGGCPMGENILCCEP